MDRVPDLPSPRIKVIGVGGAGNHMVERLRPLLTDIFAFAQINTDQRALSVCTTPEKYLIGRKQLHGLGAGGDLRSAREAAQADREKLQECIEETDLVCIVAGLGGGNGGGISSELAQLAASSGALVIALVALPFSFEGTHRRRQADESLAELRRSCHVVVPLPNDMVMQQLDDEASVLDAFSQVDNWIQSALQSLSNMLLQPGLVEVDFASLKALFQYRGGKTLYGLGEGQGASCTEEALEALLLCPLLYLPELSQSADALIVHIEGGPNLQLNQVHTMMATLTEKFASTGCTLLSAVVDENLGDKLRIFALGVSESERQKGYHLPQSESTARPATAKEPALASLQSERQKATVSQEPPHHQHELSLDNVASARGTFKATGQTLYNGEDLDVPTFLRRGVKIKAT